MTELTLDALLESAAEFGDFNYFRKVGKRDLEKLEKLGFSLKLISKTKNSWPKLYEISWKHAKVEGDLDAIDINSPDLTQAQRLWIISTKSNS